MFALDKGGVESSGCARRYSKYNDKVLRRTKRGVYIDRSSTGSREFCLRAETVQ